MAPLKSMLQTAQQPGRPGLPHLPPGTEGIAASLLPAPARELQLSRILAAPHGIWVPRAPASDETTNGTVSPDMGQQMKSSWIEGGKFEQCVQIFS